MSGAAQNDAAARNGRIALICVGVVMAMTGLAFASVPLYDLFCRVTGFGGTPMVSTVGANRVLDRTMAVRFDANVAPGLGWRFAPEQTEVKLRIGETKTIFYKVTNRSDKPTTGIASFNVTPEKGAAFFVKIECFCFTEQTLQPGETMEAPVVFYIDPDIETNKELDGMSTITLSYTFFPVKAGQPSASAQSTAAPAKAVPGDTANPKL